MSERYANGDEGYSVERQPTIALVTARQQPGVDVDVDMPLLAGRLARDARVRVIPWDDPVDWSAFDLAVIRSTWDYPWRVAEFLDWADRCALATRLANPATLIRWNCDKSYLGRLGEHGIPVVPTTYLPPGADRDLPDRGDFVVKPAVGAGARHAARYRPDEIGRAVDHVRMLHDNGITVMVQPYLATVDTAGERALVFVGGEYLHAIRKGPVLSPGAGYDGPREAHPGMRSWTPSAEEIALGRATLAAIPGTEEPLYARVDLVSGESGDPLVMELELIEPNLFLTAHPHSLDTVAAAVLRAAAAVPTSAAAVPTAAADTPASTG